MTQEDIIKLAREAASEDGATRPDKNIVLYAAKTSKFLERFAELVIAAEREKSLQLWLLLDDVDTADDIAKADDAFYRALCRQAHEKRWAVLNTDEVEAAILARGEQ